MPSHGFDELPEKKTAGYISSNFLIRAVTASGRSIDQK